MTISDKTRALAAQAERELLPVFAALEETAKYNTEKVLAAFQTHRVSEACFAGTTGYGYDDLGRDTLDKIYADVFGAEDALVRLNFVNGTHALTAGLFGLLRPGDVLLSAMGAPYDTLQTAIGITGDAPGSLREYGVRYAQVDPLPDGMPDLAGIQAALRREKCKAVFIQRSRGYSTRAALTMERMKAVIDAVRAADPDVYIMVDNCYGEFCETV